MEKLSELISKKVFALDTGECVGYVINVMLDKNFSIVEKLLIVDDESEYECEALTKNVIFKGDDVFIKSSKFISYEHGLLMDRLLGKYVFTQEASSCGLLNDIYLDNFYIISFVTNKCSFSYKQISLIGRDCIIIGKRKKIKNKQNFFDEKKSNIPSAPDQLVSISSVGEKVGQAVPYRASSDFKSLIGKIATKDIFGFNNELLVKKFEVITQKKLNDVKKHGKLSILYYNCK